jgi:broad specificity phosphatase PhoE
MGSKGGVRAAVASSPGKNIFLVRHGETDDNVALRVQGWSGTGLNAHGRLQALAAGAELARRVGSVSPRRPRRRVWTSDLARARETAEIVADALDAEVVASAAFREIRLGPWEERLVREIEARDGVALARWRRDARKPPRRGIEPLFRFRDRVLSGLNAIVSTYDEPIVVITHGGPISVILTRILGLDLKTTAQMPTENGSISRLFWEPDRYFVSSFNETGHLVARTGG